MMSPMTFDKREEQGTFTGPACNSLHYCQKCHKEIATCQAWESNDKSFIDIKITCSQCDSIRWVEGKVHEPNDV